MFLMLLDFKVCLLSIIFISTIIGLIFNFKCTDEDIFSDDRSSRGSSVSSNVSYSEDDEKEKKYKLLKKKYKLNKKINKDEKKKEKEVLTLIKFDKTNIVNSQNVTKGITNGSSKLNLNQNIIDHENKERDSMKNNKDDTKKDSCNEGCNIKKHYVYYDDYENLESEQNHYPNTINSNVNNPIIIKNNNIPLYKFNFPNNSSQNNLNRRYKSPIPNYYNFENYNA